MAALTTAALLAAVGVAGVQAHRQQQIQKRALEEQSKAQESAAARAVRDERRAEEAANKANRKKVDIQSLLASAQSDADRQANATLLTGPGGVSKQKLERKSLLGG